MNNQSCQWWMPAETYPQIRTWMSFPAGAYPGDSSEQTQQARQAWADVAKAISQFQPVWMLVTEDEQKNAQDLLKGYPNVTLYLARLDDAWMRDSGPTFVLSSDQQLRLGAVDWVFNAYGGQEWVHWAWDARVAGTVAGLADAELLPQELVAEGGGIHTDGNGTFLVTETVMQDPYRNLGWIRERVDEHLSRALGARKVIWLPRGLTRDYTPFGTRGHVDMLATFTGNPCEVLVHEQQNKEHPDYAVSQRLIELLDEATNADGRKLKVTRLPAPTQLRDECDWVDYSYVNHAVCNDAVFSCTFGDEQADQRAMTILGQAYPDRQIVGVESRPLFARGGGIHCITQQQPADGRLPVSSPDQ